jgi:hypothetical protein
VHRTGWLSSCRCKPLRWLVPDKASRRQEASADWHDASQEEGPRALRRACGRIRRENAAARRKSNTTCHARASAVQAVEALTGPRFGGNLRRATPNRRFGKLASGLSSPDRRNAAVFGSERARPTRPRAGLAQPRRGRADRIAMPTPPGNATGRGASCRSPGFDAPSGGSAGRVGGLGAACCKGIT